VSHTLLCPLFITLNSICTDSRYDSRFLDFKKDDILHTDGKVLSVPSNANSGGESNITTRIPFELTKKATCREGKAEDEGL